MSFNPDPGLYEEVQRRNLKHTDCPKGTPPLGLCLCVFDVAPIRRIRKCDSHVNIAAQHVLNGVRLQIANQLKFHVR